MWARPAGSRPAPSPAASSPPVPLVVEDGRALGDRGTVVARLGGPEVDAVRPREDGLAPAEVVAAGGDDLQDVPSALELGARSLGDEGFDLHVAARERGLGEPSRLQRLLDAEAVVGDAGHELGVGLGLVEPAHDPEADPDAVLLHEAGD